MLAIPFDIKTRSFRSKVKIYNRFLNYIEIDCLWDTGATRSTIPEYFARLLQLKTVCSSIVNGNNGKTISSIYEATVELDNHTEVIYPNGNNLDFVLIGMDIISKGEMYIENINGNLTMYFEFV